MKDERRSFRPVEQEVYENHGGGTFRCMAKPFGRGRRWSAIMQNVKSGWTFIAKDIRRYPDGRIDWAYSTQGHFMEVHDETV